jgi:hypothetical protein
MKTKEITSIEIETLFPFLENQDLKFWKTENVLL